MGVSDDTLARVALVVAQGGRLTVRDVAAATHVSVGTAYTALSALRDEGIVDWEDGKMGTMHSLVCALYV